MPAPLPFCVLTRQSVKVHISASQCSHLVLCRWYDYSGDALVQTETFGSAMIAPLTHREIARVATGLVRKTPFECV